MDPGNKEKVNGPWLNMLRKSCKMWCNKGSSDRDIKQLVNWCLKGKWPLGQGEETHSHAILTTSDGKSGLNKINKI